MLSFAMMRVDARCPQPAGKKLPPDLTSLVNASIVIHRFVISMVRNGCARVTSGCLSSCRFMGTTTRAR
jgi:hypothetical protein